MKLIQRKVLTWNQFNKIEYPLMYGYGTMSLQRLGLGSTWGHMGSSGSFLFYSEQTETYVAGTINSVGLHSTVINLINSLLYYTKTQTIDL